MGVNQALHSRPVWSWYFCYFVHDIVNLGVFLYLIVWIFREKSEKKSLENLPGAAPTQLGTLKMEEIRMVFQVLVKNGNICPAEEYLTLKYGQKCCWTLAGILDTGSNSHRVSGKMSPVPSGIPSSSFSFCSPLFPVEGAWIPYLCISLERWNKKSFGLFSSSLQQELEICMAGRDGQEFCPGLLIQEFFL